MQRGSVLACIQTFTSSFHADELGVFKRNIGVEDAHGVGATAHAGHNGIGLLGGHLQFLEELGHLREALLANHALKIAHHGRVGAGPATVPMM